MAMKILRELKGDLNAELLGVQFAVALAARVQIYPHKPQSICSSWQLLAESIEAFLSKGKVLMKS